MRTQYTISWVSEISGRISMPVFGKDRLRLYRSRPGFRVEKVERVPLPVDTGPECVVCGNGVDDGFKTCSQSCARDYY